MPEKFDRVYLCECWARDGLQNMEKIITTQDKVLMINDIAKAGYARVEATSFSNPKRLPQFADAEQVLQQIERPPGVSFKVTCVNGRAVARAITAKENGYGPDEVSFMISVSEAHNKINTGMTHKEHWNQFEAMIGPVLDNGMRPIATIGTAFGCPIDGDVPQKKVFEFVRHYTDLGATWISLGDTTGAANPIQVKEMYGELKTLFPHITFIAHFHDTRGTGIANCYAAYEAGVRYFDVSLGGIGGQPTGATKYHLGFSGNTVSEDLVCMFEEAGIHTGISPDTIIRLGLKAEEVLGCTQKSNVIRCGRVKH